MFIFRDPKHKWLCGFALNLARAKAWLALALRLLPMILFALLVCFAREPWMFWGGFALLGIYATVLGSYSHHIAEKEDKIFEKHDNAKNRDNQ